MRRPPRSAFLFVVAAVGTFGCGETGVPDAGALDARASRDAPRSDSALDAFTPSAEDAWCGQTEPDPDRTVQCSPCEPRCFLTREQPGPGDLAGEELEHDATAGGVRLRLGTDGRHVPEGRHERVHDSSLTCDPRTDVPYWRTLPYSVLVPEGTSLDFELRSASSEAALGSATPAVVRAVSGFGEIPVAEALLTTGGMTSGSFLSVTAVLHASPDGARSPVLHHYDLRYTCVAAF